MKNNNNEHVGAILFWIIIAIFGILCSIAAIVDIRSANDMPPDEPAKGVAWVMPEAGEVPVWLSPVCAGEAETAVRLDSYTAGDGPAPEWWRPDEEMSAEWEADVADIFVGDMNVLSKPHPPVGISPGGIDWNLCTDLVGWDGHRMEIWEMDLFSRIVYLEFGITSPECREAGIDAILRLWESGYYSSTMFGTLSAVAENGKPSFSTYPGVWEEEYDYEKLARFREECEERFVNGPEWTAPFFRTGHYHEWAEPCYAFVEDNVYFSTGKGWK